MYYYCYYYYVYYYCTLYIHVLLVYSTTSQTLLVHVHSIHLQNIQGYSQFKSVNVLTHYRYSFLLMADLPYIPGRVGPTYMYVHLHIYLIFLI